MTDDIANLTLRLLQEMRGDIAAFRKDTEAQFVELRAQTGILAQGLTGVRNELKDIRADVKNMGGQIGELAIAVDHHGTRPHRGAPRPRGPEARAGPEHALKCKAPCSP
jgi:hypothetical protein